MSDTQDQVEPVKGGGKGKGRSPGYPFVALGKAVGRAKTFYDVEGRHLVPVSSVYAAWVLSPKATASRQTLAALKQYGLAEDEGAGSNRKVKLTERALHILLDKREESPERAKLIREAALTPTIYKIMWDKWGVNLPSEATIQTFLILERGYNEDSTPDVIKNYKNTLGYAGLDEPDNMPAETEDEATKKEDDDGELPEVGDLVQIEINGAFQLENPALVRAIQEHEDETWVFIEGSETGIPMEQMIITQKGSGSGEGNIHTQPPVLPENQDTPPKPGSRKDMTSLDEGDAILTWPREISKDSYYDLEAFLEGVLRKAARRVSVDREPKKK